MKNPKNINAEKVRISLVARHSLLLALEPRQVFDAAVGAALGEVLSADQNDNAAQEPAEHGVILVGPNLAMGKVDISVLLASGSSDGRYNPDRAYGDMSPFAAEGGHAPILSIAGGSASSLSSEPFQLSGIMISDADGDQERHDLLLKPGSFGIFQGPIDIPGVTLGADGKSLYFSNMTISEINAALAQFSFDSQGQFGKATILYTLTDPVTPPVEYYFEVNFIYDNTEPTLNVEWSDGSSSDISSNIPSSLDNIFDIAVSDNENNRLRLTINVNTAADGSPIGGFRYNQVYGVTYESGEGYLILEGTQEQINWILSNLSYIAGDPGLVEFTFSLSDLNPETNTWNEPIYSDVYEVLVNDPPTLSNQDFDGSMVENSENAAPGAQTEVDFSGIIVYDRNGTHDGGGDDTMTMVLQLNNPDPLNPIGYLTCDYYDQSKFTISDDGQTLTIASGLNYQEVQAILNATTFKSNPGTNGTLSFTVTVEDSFGSTATITDNITVSPVNDPPEVNISDDSSDWPSAFEDGSVTLTLEHLGLAGDGPGGTSDPDTPAHQVMVTLKGLPGQGAIYRDGVLLGVGATFSLEDVINGRITYKHDGSDVSYTGETDSFLFTVDDGSGTITDENGQPFEVTVLLNPVNQDFNVGSDHGKDADGNLILWAWERQNDAGLVAGSGNDNDVIPGTGIIINTGDDPIDDFRIKVTDLDLDGGRLYLLLPDGTERTLNIGDEFDGDLLQYLRFEATDAEPEDTSPTFKLQFADRKGGLDADDRGNPDLAYDFSQDEANVKEYSFAINIAPNNDDPYLENNTGLGTGTQAGDDPNERVDIHDDTGKRITITSDMLSVADVDSEPDQLTYTLTEEPEYGVLLLYMDGEWVKLGVGSSFTQEDIDSGRVAFEYHQNKVPAELWETAQDDGDGKYLELDTSFKFTVTDRGVSSWPNTDRRGGIYGDYYENEGNPYDPDAELMEITFDINLKAHEYEYEETDYEYKEYLPPEITVNNDQVPIISEADDQVPEYESSFPLTEDIIEIIQGGNSEGIENQDNDSLVLSLLSNPKYGVLMLNVGTAENPVWEQIFIGGQFTYQDVLDGNVRYFHNGNEGFQDDFRFLVSDGIHYVYDTTDGDDIKIIVNVKPYNDAPDISVAEEVKVNQDDYVILDGDYFNLTDPDAPRGTNDPGDPNYPKYNGDGSERTEDFTPDNLYLVITSLPDSSTGKLQYQGSDGQWYDVELDENGEFVMSEDDVNAGKLRYLHLGEQKFNDSFTVKARDDSSENGGPRDSDERTLNIEIIKVNKAPTLEDNTGIDQSHGREGDTITIWGKDTPNEGDPQINTSDPDNDSGQIIYKITSGTEYGTLYRDGVPLGEGSTFTQEDLDSGRITYESSDKNQHKDSFSFVVSDGSLYYEDGQEQTFDINLAPVNEAPEFTGMGDSDVLYKDDTDPIQICIDGAQESDPEKYIQIQDPDVPENYDPDVTNLNDYMELTITLNSKDSGGNYLLLEDGSKLYLDPGFDIGNLVVENPNDGTLILKGTLEEINEALKHLFFQSQDDGQADTNQTIYIVFDVNDCNNGGTGEHTAESEGHLKADPKVLTIYVSPVNDSPEAVGDITQVDVLEDSFDNLFIKGEEGRDLQFTDPDAFDTADNVLEILVEDGTLIYTGFLPDGVTMETFSEGGKTGLRFTGTNEQLNEILYDIKYQPQTDYNGTTEVVVRYTDQGNVGVSQTDTVAEVTFDLKVWAVNDKPTVETNPDEFDKYQVSDATLTPTLDLDGQNGQDHGDHYQLDLGGKIIIGDAKDEVPQAAWDTSEDLITVTISTANKYDSNNPLGYFSTNDGSDFEDLFNSPGSGVINNEADGTITFTGTWDEVRAALDKLAYNLDKDAYSGLQLVKVTVEIDDHGNGAEREDLKGETTDTTAFLINVSTDPNESPIITGEDLTFYEDLYGLDSSYLQLVQGSNPPVYGINLAQFMNDQGSPLYVSDADSFYLKVFYSLSISQGGSLYLYGEEINFDNPLEAGSDKAVGSPGWYSDGLTITELNSLLDNLVFVPDTDWNGDITIRLTVDDKGNTGPVPEGTPELPKNPDDWESGRSYVNENGGLVTVQDFTITIKPVNDAPTITDGDKLVIMTPAIAEDVEDSANQGQSVEDLFSDRFQDLKDNPQGSEVIDQAGDFAGILVIDDGSNDDQGHWEYYDGGTDSWVRVTPENGELSDGNALFLDKDTKLRFVPAEDYNGDSPRLTVRLVENTPEVTQFPFGEDTPYPELVDGQTYNLGDGGVYGEIGVDYRPYTQDTLQLQVAITAVNDPPVITVPDENKPGYETPYVAEEDRPLTLDGLSIYDVDEELWTGEAGEYTLTLSVENGTLSVGDFSSYDSVSVTGSGSGSLTITGNYSDLQALLDAGLITYQGTKDYYGPDNLTVTLNDNGNYGEGGPQSDSKTVGITVVPINDAPNVDGDGQESGDILKPFEPVDEDAESTESLTVADIFESHFNDEIDRRYGGTAPDVPEQYTFAGILITANLADPGEGVWQYYKDGQWHDIPTDLSGQGLYLDKDVELRFVPAPDYNGTPGELQAHVVDATTDLTTTGTPVAMPEVGGETAISEGWLGVTVTVNPVNDAPEWKPDTPGTIGSIRVDEDTPADGTSNPGSKVSDLVEDYFSDPKDQLSNSDGSQADDFAGILVTDVVNDPDKGYWQYSTDGGGTWHNLELNPGQALLLDGDALLHFVPSPNYYGPADGLTVHLIDDSGGAVDSGRFIALPEVGGTTPYSQDSRNIDAFVDPVNDAPVVADGGVVEDVEFKIPNPGDRDGYNLSRRIDTLMGPHFTDPNDANFGDGSDADQFQGVLIIGTDTTPPLSGAKWQYQLAGDDTWYDFPDDIGPDNAFYLPKDASVRIDGDFDTEVELVFDCLLVETGDQQVYVPGDSYDVSGPEDTGGTTQVSVLDVPLTVKMRIVVENEPPEVEVPLESLQAIEDTPLTVSGLNFIDVNAKDTFTVTITAEHGTLNFADYPGITVISGQDTGEIVIQGLAKDLNQAIADGLLTYQGDLDYNGQDTLTVEVTDQGTLNHETGLYEDPLSSDPAVITIDVAPVNDAPEVTIPEVTLPPQISGTQDRDGYKVEDLFKPSFTDRRDQLEEPSNTFRGVFVTESLANPLTEGVWQYYDGSQWVTLDPSPGEAIYLDSDVSIRFLSVNGFSGQPGELKVHLVENSESETGPATELPEDLVTGSVFDLTAEGQTGGDSRVSLDEVSVTIEILPAFTPGINTEVPQNFYHNVDQDVLPWAYLSDWTNPTFSYNVSRYLREGLDSPEFRHGWALDAGGQYSHLITRNHVASVVEEGSALLEKSITGCFSLIKGYETPKSSVLQVSEAPKEIMEAEEEEHEEIIEPLIEEVQEEARLIEPENGSPGLASSETGNDEYVVAAMYQFKDLWADKSAEAEPLTLPGDTDLDQQVRGCAMNSLLAEAKKMLQTLTS